MKKLTKLFTAIALVSALALVGCANPSAPSTDTKPNPGKETEDTSKLDKERFDSVVSKITIDEVLNSDSLYIYLPQFENGVIITWTSSDDKVIKADGSVTPKDTTETVKLTATFTYKEYTAKKEFNVKVYGKGADITIDDADLLKFASSEIYTQRDETKDELKITLPTTVTSHNDKLDFSKIKISWKLLSIDPNVSLKDNVITAKKTSAAYTFKYEATLKLEEKATLTKDFLTNVNKLPNKMYEGYDGRLSVYDDYIEFNDKRYTYKKAEGDNVYYLKKQALIMDPPYSQSWVTVEECLKLIRNDFNLDVLLPAAKTLEANPTIENLSKVLNNFPSAMIIPSKDPYDFLLKMNAYPNTIKTIEDAKKASVEDNKAAIKKAIMIFKLSFGTNMLYMSAEEAKKMSFDSMLEQISYLPIDMNGCGPRDIREFKAIFNEISKPVTLTAMFEANQPFEMQMGEYVSKDKKVILNVNPLFKIGSLRFYKNENSGRYEEHSVKYNDDYKKFTSTSEVNGPSETPKVVEWSLDYDNTNGNVTMTNLTNASEKYVLEFNPTCFFKESDGGPR